MKLTDTQLVLLSRAAQRDDRALELPSGGKGDAARKLAVTLVSAGLVEEIASAGSLPVWRRDDEQGPRSLRISAIGLKAIAADDDANRQRGKTTESGTRIRSTGHRARSTRRAKGTKRARQANVPHAGQGRTGSKQAVVLRLLHRRSGVSLAAIVQQTDWQPHSVRGFLAGIVRKKLGLQLVSEKVRGQRVYRVEGKKRSKAAVRRRARRKAV